MRRFNRRTQVVFLAALLAVMLLGVYLVGALIPAATLSPLFTKRCL